MVRYTLISLFFLIPSYSRAESSAFIFANTYPCAGNAPELCQQELSAVKPKAWSDVEKSELIAIINSLEKALPGFMAKVESLAPIQMHRITNGTQWNKTSNHFNPYPYFGDAQSSGMDLTDLSFINDAQIESEYGSTILEHVFLHELAHIYDFASGNISVRSPFTELTHWMLAGSGDVGQTTYASGINMQGYDASAVDSVNSQMRDLIAQGKYFEAASVTHAYGVKFGYPSSYAMSAPVEDFAESISWEYFDKNASSYLTNPVFSYIKLLLK